MTNSSNTALSSRVRSHFHWVTCPASMWLYQEKFWGAEQSTCMLSVCCLIGYCCSVLWDTSSPTLFHIRFFLQLFSVPTAPACGLMLSGPLAVGGSSGGLMVCRNNSPEHLRKRGLMQQVNIASHCWYLLTSMLEQVWGCTVKSLQNSLQAVQLQAVQSYWILFILIPERQKRWLLGVLLFVLHRPV